MALAVKRRQAGHQSVHTPVGAGTSRFRASPIRGVSLGTRASLDSRHQITRRGNGVFKRPEPHWHRPVSHPGSQSQETRLGSRSKGRLRLSRKCTSLNYPSYHVSFGREPKEKQHTTEYTTYPSMTEPLTSHGDAKSRTTSSRNKERGSSSGGLSRSCGGGSSGGLLLLKQRARLLVRLGLVREPAHNVPPASVKRHLQEEHATTSPG